VQIVGVVKDARQTAAREIQELYAPPAPEIFVPLQQHAAATLDLGLLIRTVSDPAAASDAVRRQVRSIDSGQPVYDVETLQQLAEDTLGPARLALVLLSIFAGMALLIASVGLYAIVAYAVSQRSQEIGIRMALGARRWDVLRLMMRQVMSWAVSGLVVGFAASLGLTRLMSRLLFGVRPNDVATLVTVSVVLLGVALLASYLPARRAIQVDPLVALRSE
jgi:putative ABC transport system permease protein